MYQDTIAAISTPIGEGGIGIIRISGPDARKIAERVFPKRLASRRLVYGHIVDPETRERIDEVLVAYMAAPNTYTREDVVEINCHGGPLPLQRTLELVLREGARAANPGEFTLRAFLNGRIDLAQAEAVMDVIQARTAASLRVAMAGVGGKLSGEIRVVREAILGVLAYLTARIDFPEDDVAEQDITESLADCRSMVERLIESADAGIIYRQGVRTAIVGRPNVGKSSLLNRLLRDSRAIVTEVPGTTRDTLEEVVNIKGVPFVLVDTAGIRQSSDIVERMGVDRSRRAIEQADLVLLVLDGSQDLSEYDKTIIEMVADKAVIAIANKSDLGKRSEISDLPWEALSLSTLTGAGLADLEERMVQSVMGGKVITGDSLLVSNPRHKDALQRAEQHLAAAEESYHADMPADFISIDLTAALMALGEITGDEVGEDLLEAIFSRFCIGK